MIPLNQMTKKDNKPEWIIVHHTGGTNANPLADTSHHTFETIQSWHINGRGWENIGYHWVIEKDGRVRKGRPEHYHGAHTKAVNKKSVGVVLTGNFDAKKPTEAQIEALRGLLKDIQDRWDISTDKIVPHRKFASKSCFGNLLPDDWARNLIKENHTDCVPNEFGALLKALLAKINAR